MLLVPRQGREADALILSAAHCSQLCLLLPLLPGTYWRCEGFWGGYSEVGAALRIRPNLGEAGEAELRVLGFDFTLNLIDSSALQEAQQPS